MSNFVGIQRTDKYTIRYPNVSLHLTRSKVLHDKRRRIWDRAFTTKGRLIVAPTMTNSNTDRTLLALREYEGRVRGFTNQLISVLDSKTGQSINATRWFNFYSFDIMGDMAFGTSIFACRIRVLGISRDFGSLFLKKFKKNPY